MTAKCARLHPKRDWTSTEGGGESYNLRKKSKSDYFPSLQVGIEKCFLVLPLVETVFNKGILFSVQLVLKNLIIVPRISDVFEGNRSHCRATTAKCLTTSVVFGRNLPDVFTEIYTTFTGQEFCCVIVNGKESLEKLEAMVLPRNSRISSAYFFCTDLTKFSVL